INTANDITPLTNYTDSGTVVTRIVENRAEVPCIGSWVVYLHLLGRRVTSTTGIVAPSYGPQFSIEREDPRKREIGRQGRSDCAPTVRCGVIGVVDILVPAHDVDSPTDGRCAYLCLPGRHRCFCRERICHRIVLIYVG